MLCHCLLVTTLSNEKLAIHINMVPVYMTSCSSLAVFKIFSLSFGNLICLDVEIFLFTPWSSLSFLDVKSNDSYQIGEIFSYYFFQNCVHSLSFPSGTPITHMWVFLMYSTGLRDSVHFSLFLFLSFLQIGASVLTYLQVS